MRFFRLFPSNIQYSDFRQSLAFIFVFKRGERLEEKAFVCTQGQNGKKVKEGASSNQKVSDFTFSTIDCNYELSNCTGITCTRPYYDKFIGIYMNLLVSVFRPRNLTLVRQRLLSERSPGVSQF